MVNNIKYKKQISTKVLMVLVFVLSIIMTACEFELPEANSINDATPPSADFGETLGDDYLTYKFANYSISATDYVWNFGDGATSTELDPIHVYAAASTDEDGTLYSVTLTATDKLGVVSTFSKDIVVLKPEVPAAIVPVILNPSFDDPGEDGKYLLPWVPPSAIGKTPQSSSSSSFVGGKAGKFPSVSDARIGYQKDIAVTKNTDYVITYNYSIESGDDTSSLTVAILAGNITDASEVAGATIKSHVGTIAVGKTPFETVDIAFNSGDNNIISIHISNTGSKNGYVEEFYAKVAE